MPMVFSFLGRVLRQRYLFRAGVELTGEPKLTHPSTSVFCLHGTELTCDHPMEFRAPRVAAPQSHIVEGTPVPVCPGLQPVA